MSAALTQITGYNVMWLMAMFDLPVDDTAARRQYARFRRLLLQSGFSKLQYSVYALCCESEATAVAQRSQISQKLPPDGQVRLLMITDRQFGKMEVYHGKTRVDNEEKPRQLELF